MIQNVQKAGAYELTEALRVGKTGSSYISSYQNSKAVVKVLNSSLRFDPAVQALFFSELETITNLQHPGIARVLDFGEDGVRYFVVSEWVADGSLNTWLQLQTREQAHPDRHTAVELMRQLAEALAYAHRKGAVHWQLEPENILLSKVGQRYVLKISDFGLARVVTQSDPDGVLVNDPKYISPEHVLGVRAEPTSDMYSFGVLMFHAFTGSVPFQVRDLGEAANKHVYEQPRALRELDAQIPAELESLVLRCLHKRPSERPTAEEARDALQAILERHYPSVRATRMLLGHEREVQSPNFEAPTGRCDNPRISVVDNLGQVLFVREIPPSSLTLGRDPSNSLVLESDTVSRNHLRLEYNGREVRVTDLSSNGTFLIGGSSAGGRLAFQTPTVFPWRGIVQVAPYWIRLEQPSSMAEPNRIAVTLERDRAEFTPGIGMPIRVNVANLGAITDHLSLEVLGVPKEWVTYPEKEVFLNKGMQSPVVISVHVPRSSEAVARDYNVTVRARSLDKPEDFGEAHATWLVLPFGQASLQMRPGNRSTRRKTQYSAVFRNESNIPLKVQLSASDEGNKFFFAFNEEKPRPQLPPGARGVFMRWGQILAFPFILAFRTMVESTIGPMLRKANLITRDLQQLTGQEQENEIKKIKAAPEARIPISPQVTIAPGESQSVPLDTWVNWRLVGRTIQRPFKVNAHAVGLEERWKDSNSTLHRDVIPKTVDANLSHLAVFPVWVPPVIAAILALLAFIVMRNPSIDRLRTVPDVVKVGQSFQVLCDVSSAANIELIYDGNKSIKSKTCKFLVPGIQNTTKYTIVAKNFLPAFGFGVATKELPKTPKRDPKIATLEEFAIIGVTSGKEKFDLVEGNKRSIQFRCKGNNIVSLELQAPSGAKTYRSCQLLAQDAPFSFDTPGKYEFQLQAKGEPGAAQPLPKKIMVEIKPAKPSIVFSVSPSVVVKGESGDITLSWRVANAVKVEITTLADVPPSGTQSVPAPTDSDTYTLKAKNFDLEESKSVSVTVREPLPVAAVPTPTTTLPPVVRPEPQKPVVTQANKPPKPPKPLITTTPDKPPVDNKPVEQWVYYYTNFGFLEIGSFNHIRYVNKLTGEQRSNIPITLGEKFLQSEDGSVDLKFYSAQRDTFAGRSSDGRWCGALRDAVFPDDCGFSGKWNVRINGVKCTLEAQQKNNFVTGSFCDGENKRYFSGEVSFPDNRTQLYAKFKSNPNYQHLNIYIDGFESNQFRGTIGVSTGLSGINWCGWKENQSEPTDCG